MHLAPDRPSSRPVRSLWSAPAWRRLLQPPYSIRSLLLGQFVLVVLIALAVMALLLSGWRLPEVRAQHRQQQARIADLVLQQLEASLDGAESVLRAVAPLVDQAATATAAGSVLQRLVGAGDFYEGLYLLDHQMRIRALGLTPQYGAVAQEWLGKTVSGWTLTERVRRDGQLLWSEQFVSPVQGRPVVGVLLPLASGALLAEVSVARLAHVVQSAGHLEGLLVLVVDAQGVVLASPYMQDALDRINLRHLPLVRAALEGRQVFDDLPYRGGAYAGTALRSARLGWGVLVAYPVAVARAAVAGTLWITLVTVGVALAAGLLMAGWMARLIGARLDRSIGLAQGMAAGQYQFAPRASRVAELGALESALQTTGLQIHRREQQLRALVDLTPHLAVQWFDAQGRVVDWNPASCTLLGWTREEAMGKTLDQLMYTASEQQAFLRVMREVVATGQTYGPVESRARNRSGRGLYLLSTSFSVPGVAGEPLYVCMEIDITRMKEQQQLIQDSEQKFNMFFNASPVAVSVRQRMGERWVYVAVNPAWESLMLQTREETLGRDALAMGLHVDPNKMAGLAERIEAQGGSLRSESLIRRHDGSQIVGESVLALVRSGDQELIISSLHDVTDKRAMERDMRALNAQLEQRIAERTASLSQANDELRQALQHLQQTQDRLVQSEKLASLGALVAGVAHELNTPIGNGLMAASTLQARLHEFEQRYAAGLRRSDMEVFLQQLRDGLTVAIRNLERSSSLIKSFKQVSVDQTSEQKRRFDLRELVDSILLTLHPMLKRLPYRVEVAIAPGLMMDSYPGALGQVLTNLIQNAVLHGLDGRPQGLIQISAEAGGEQVRLTVADDGHGIDPAQQRHLFDPFYTTRLGQGGSGLGLFIVRNIVTGILQGSISVHSAPGEGMRLVLGLRRAVPGARAAATSPMPPVAM